MEDKFLAAWENARTNAQNRGVRLRPMALSLESARRQLSGNRVSDGFDALADKGLLAWSLEALAIDKRFTGLFSDEQANNALTRLLEAGYRF